MACKFCTKAPIRLVRELDRDVNDGDLSVAEIADKFGLAIKTVRIHLKKCLGGTPITGYALLQKNLRSLEKLAKETKEEYDNIDIYDEGSGADKGFTMKRLLDVRREQRESIMALDRIKPSDQLMDEILQSVISPLILNTTEVCTEELGRLRKTLSAQLDGEAYIHIDIAVKDSLLRIGERLYQEKIQIQPNLKKILHSEHARKGVFKKPLAKTRRKKEPSPLDSSSGSSDTFLH